MAGNIYTDVGPANSGVAPTAADWSPSLPTGDAAPGPRSSTLFSDGTVAADGPAGSTLTIAIAGTTIGGTYLPGTFVNDGEIEVAPGTGLGNALDGVTDGDTIEFGAGMTIAGASVINGNTLMLATNAAGGGSGTHALTDVGSAPGVTPHLCFLPGTLISTPSGEVPVERLAVGDRVMTVGGQARAVVWIGQGEVLATRGQRNAATPVIVRKGAFAPNVPHSDLRVTKGHSFLFDGVLIPVECLVNHRSILWDDRAQKISIYHVELETHDVLLANGAAAESYRDDGNRCLFLNANIGWDQPPKPPCAPRLTGGEVVDAVWRLLLDRAGTRPSVPLTEDADAHLVVDGLRVEAVWLEPADGESEVALFTLPAAARSVRLASRAAVPEELGIARDTRCLGVAVRRIVVRKETRFRVMQAHDPALAEGFHAFEARLGLRWTNGDAVVPAGLFDGFDGAVELVVHLGGTTRYVDDGPAGAWRDSGTNQMVRSGVGTKSWMAGPGPAMTQRQVRP